MSDDERLDQNGKILKSYSCFSKEAGTCFGRIRLAGCPDMKDSRQDKKECSLMNSYSQGMSTRSQCILIEVECGVVLYYNRAMLLNKVMEYGSVEYAAKSITIPTDHANELTAVMNKSARLPLVEITGEDIKVKQVRLTKEGERSLKSYWKLYKEFKLSLCLEMKEYRDLSASHCVDK